MEQLAIFGGTPVRETPIYYGRQFIDDDDVAAVVQTLQSDLITCGPRVEELERKLCEVTEAKYAVVVSNGTAALHLAAMAAGIGEGDELHLQLQPIVYYIVAEHRYLRILTHIPIILNRNLLKN